MDLMVTTKMFGKDFAVLGTQIGSSLAVFLHHLSLELVLEAVTASAICLTPWVSIC